MEIISSLHRIPGMRGANAYLLLGSPMTLVDTGMPGSDETILAYIDSLGLDARSLERIIITHHHLDHVGSAAALKRRTSAQVLAHPGDALFISGEQAPRPPQSPVMRFLFRLMAPLMPSAEAVSIDLAVQDNDHLDLLGGAAVVHVPGHSPGAIALHFPSEGLLICGDAIDHRRGRLGPPPKAFTMDMDQAITSIRRMAELEFDILCPGHGTPLVGRADELVRAMVRGLG
jgi:glyoxylase-like metal-dependent hydrolase (beta-lactamase superfamily II)